MVTHGCIYIVVLGIINRHERKYRPDNRKPNNREVLEKQSIVFLIVEANS